jgi:hypothetical protein
MDLHSQFPWTGFAFWDSVSVCVSLLELDREGKKGRRQVISISVAEPDSAIQVFYSGSGTVMVIWWWCDWHWHRIDRHGITLQHFRTIEWIFTISVLKHNYRYSDSDSILNSNPGPKSPILNTRLWWYRRVIFASKQRFYVLFTYMSSIYARK